MKKLLLCLLALLLLAGCAECPECEKCEECAPAAKTVADLPAARDTSKKDGENACALNSYSLACSSIDSSNLKDYLGIDGVVYIDARDFSDYAKKHLKNFEVVPFFGLVYNKAEDDTTHLFHGAEFKATFEESIEILHQLVPTDKVVFLMCQSGGRIKTFMQILDAAGYDMTKIYNVGGMAQYDSYADLGLVTNVEEIVVEATYSLNGLTLVK